VGEFRKMPDAPLDQHIFETVVTAGLTLFSDSPPPPLLHDIVGRIAPRPVFLIWATHGVDTEALSPGFYRAAGEPKTLWEVPEAKHTQAIRARPAEYERRVVGFLDHALL
jgi:hypothetical protein